MIDDPNIEHEDKPEYDEEGNQIWYMPVLPEMDEFTSYNFNDVPENIPEDYYESVWSNGTASTSVTAKAAGEALTDPIDVIIENTDTDYKDEQGQINALEIKYNEAANKIVSVLTNVLQKGSITGEDNAEFLAAQHELTMYSGKIKDLCDIQTKDGEIKSASEIKSKFQTSTVDEILDLLTEGGTKPWLYKDDNNNVLVDGQSIPELTVLVNKLNLIATNGGDDGSKLTLTPEFIDMVVQSAGSGDSVNSVTTMYYLSTSKTELVGGAWTATLPTSTEQQGKYLWYKIVTTYMDSEKDPTESEPICISSNDGVTHYTWIRYADDDSGNGISNDPTGKKYIGFAYNKTTATESNTPSDYTWSRIQGEKGDTGVKGETGADGTTYYTWIKYSDNPDGTGLYDLPKDSTKYIGIAANKTTAAESSDKSDYIWSKFKGEDGKDGTGINIIDKLPDTSHLPATGNAGDGYTINGVLYIWSVDTNTWVNVGNIKGEQGEPGKSSYLHIKYSDDGMTFTANDGETPGIYIGVLTDNTEADSTDFNDYTWSRIRGDQGLQGLQGEKGEQGIQGEKGDPGKTTYFHIKYSSNSNGNPMSETPDTYIGTYVDYTPTDSTDYTKYNWSRFQGLQGEKGDQGIPGTDGSNGQTYYLHIKYSNDGGSTFTSNNGETPGTYIGVYTDTTQADSTSVSEYTWSKIKGEEGPQGVPGDDGRGVESVVIEYAKNQSTTTAPTSEWSTTMPTYQEGYYLWMRTRIKYTDSTDYVYSDPVCDQSWKANQEVYTQYKQLSDKFTWIVSGGDSQSTMTLTNTMYQLISKNITLTADRINLNGYISNDDANWSIDNEGNMNVEDLTVDGNLSVDTITISNIVSPKYPGVVTENLWLYVGTTGSDDNKLESGVTFQTFDGLLDKLPKNLNGYEVRIEMSTDITENVVFKGFHGGKITLYMKGHTLYGYVVSKIGSARINICSGYIGNATDESNGWGKIHPSKGYAVSTYTATVACADPGAIGLYNIDVYGADNYLSESSTKLGIASQDFGAVYINGVSYYGCDVGSRANAGGRIHDVLSYKVCTKYGCYATTGGYITLAGGTHAGGQTNNYQESHAGQVIVASDATFEGGEVSIPGGSAPIITTKTVAVSSTSGDTYRSTVYNNWKKDNTVRQGDYGYGDCNGCWFFGNQFEQFEGKTITKVTIKITRQRGGSSAAVGLVVKSHGYANRPSGAPTYKTTAGTLSLATGASGTLTITDSTILNGISDGTLKGFGIQSTYDSSHYAVCSGTVTVKVTYTD